MQEQELKLLFGQKGEILCKEVFSCYRRFPTFFPKTLLSETAHFLSVCSPAFLEDHEIPTLRRILFTLHRFIEEAEDAGPKISFRIFEINPSVYGIVIANFSLLDDELFNQRHILKAVHNLLPGVKLIPDGYIHFHFQKVPLYYLEIKKMRGGNFSPQEKELLVSKLSTEMQQSTDRVTPYSQSLIVPGNEEELFKNIRPLSAQLRSTSDIPQVMISFVGHQQETLKFLVIAVRVLTPGTPSIISLSERLPSAIIFSVEHVHLLDKILKKYPKEAAVFTLEMQSTPFLRGNSSLNLHATRNYIAKSLEVMFGPFRDYNGGLLIKENEQLQSIKASLKGKGGMTTEIDTLFYAIKPTVLRASLSIQTGIDLILLFQKMATRHLEGICLIDFQVSKEAHLAVVRTKERRWKNFLPQKILNYSTKMGCSSFDYEGESYFCFFHQDLESQLLFEAIEKEIHTNLSAGERKIIKINFQGGDPPSLNPLLATDIHCHTLNNFLFEGLFRLNSVGVVEPALAEKVEISPCNMFYTFSLRPSWWSNGEEVTAYHFERSWKKAVMTARQGFIYPDFFSSIKNAKQAREHALSVDEIGIYVKDAKTLCVELEFPCPNFLNFLTTPPFFPLFGETEEPSEFNGPFVVSKWQADRQLLLVQNPFYWEAPKIKLGGINISMERDPDVAYKMFLKGDLDFVGDPISPLAPEILRNPEIQKQMVSKSISRVFWIHCNTRSFPLDNVNLRKALSLALDRKKIVEKAFIHQVPHGSLLPPKYATSKGHLEQNVEEARTFFKKALKELKMESETALSLTFNHSDLSFEKKMVEELQRQWKEVLGLNLVPVAITWNDFSASLEKGSFQLGGLFRRDLLNDPVFYFNFFKNSPHNPHRWDHPLYNKLLQEYSQEPHCVEKLQQLERILSDEVPAIALVSQNYLALTNASIQGVSWHENGCLDLKGAFFHE